MPELDQIAGKLAAAIHIIVANGITVIFSRLIIDHHNWTGIFAQQAGMNGAAWGG